MTKNESIPTPERSKEETGVRRLLDDGVIEAIHSVYQMKVREYDADFRRDTPEGFWQKKYGTNLHSTGLGERWALKEALSQAISAIETPPLHKEGEAVATINAQGGVLMTEAGEEWFKALRNMKAPLGQVAAYLYATPAPVPVPVTIPNEKWSDREPIYEAAMAAYEANTPKDYRYSAIAMVKAVDAAIAVIEAALSAKPGEQG